ncbi:Asp23/Gls24 family envelope stress response protein [Streptomyces californicus]
MADVQTQDDSQQDRWTRPRGSGGRGKTTISDNVVSTIAGIAIRETDGVHSVGRAASKALGTVTGRRSGASGARRAVKVPGRFPARRMSRLGRR